MLEIERMSVPVTELSISADSDGRLWTDRLVMSQDDRSGATVTVAPEHPSNSDFSRVAEPRSRRARGSLFQAFAGHWTAEDRLGA